MLRNFGLHARGHFRMFRLRTQVIGKDNRLLVNEVNKAPKIAFTANRNLNWHWNGAQAITNHFHCAPEISANAVHLIYKTDTRNIILIRLTPYCFRLGFNACNRIKDNNASVQYAQRAFDFSGEVNVAWRVNDIDALIKPETGCSGRRNRNAALLLLGHPVHCRRPFMHFTHAMNFLRVEEDALSSSGFASINMSNNTNISSFFEWEFSYHDI